VRAELYLSQYTLDIKYRANKNNIVPNIFSRLTRLKYDSNSLFKNKDIFEDAINKYDYINFYRVYDRIRVSLYLSRTVQTA
jgi:hypothetical protein